jgi:putative membrane protein
MSSEATHMAETQSAADADRFEVRVTADSHFGWIRTRLSLERTMMAWVRTATALIGFGFAIVQYLDRLQQLPDTRPAYLPNAPQCLGLALIACGILALVVSLRQYFWTTRYLSGGAFAPIARMKAEGLQSPVVAIALLLICIGLFAFFAVLLRLA